MHHCSIKGFQGTSLIDYPGRIASIIFTGGCNFRCRYCYNTQLVSATALPDLDYDAVIADLKKRKGFIEGVVVTGGEPTIHPGIIDLLYAVRRMKLDVKLDTNGTHPEILEWVIEEKLAQYIAMDYKAPISKLEKVAGIRGAAQRVEASARLLIKNADRYEFRTTVHPLLHDLDDLDTIANEIAGARAYYLQQYHPFNSLDEKLMKSNPYNPDFFTTAARRLHSKFPVFGLRNLPDCEDTIWRSENVAYRETSDSAGVRSNSVPSTTIQ